MEPILFLSSQEILRLLAMADAIPAVEEAFRAYGAGSAQMPPKIYLDLPKGDFRAMPAAIPGICGLKWVNVHPNNRQHGLPTVMAILILSDPDKGLPRAIMDATTLTNLRTGAAGAIAAKYLARKDSRKVALLGCGAQGKNQLLGLKEVLSIEKVKLFDVVPGMAKKLLAETDIEAEFEVYPDPKTCVAAADLIVTTTPSRQPLVMSSWVTDGVHINAIGADAPGKEELDPEILKRARIVVDDWSQASHSGEINVPLRQGLLTRDDVYAELGEIVAGKKPWVRNEGEITVFDSTGLAIQDLAVGKLVYERAKQAGVGVLLSF